MDWFLAWNDLQLPGKLCRSYIRVLVCIRRTSMRNIWYSDQIILIHLGVAMSIPKVARFAQRIVWFIKSNTLARSMKTMSTVFPLTRFSVMRRFVRQDRYCMHSFNFYLMIHDHVNGRSSILTITFLEDCIDFRRPYPSEVSSWRHFTSIAGKHNLGFSMMTIFLHVTASWVLFPTGQPWLTNHHSKTK